jgi:uncharacterized protein YecE (DUF72 family)
MDERAASKSTGTPAFSLACAASTHDTELAMHILAGTSGYSYKEWLGRFYPPKLPAAKMLAHYATLLPTVEINNTFYRQPNPAMLEGWAAQVPETFRFAVKASRRITHIKRLANAESETRYLLEILGALGARLGAVLFQLPPYQRVDLARLEAFLALLPAGTQAAFEFRHESWLDNAVFALLARHACALCASDVDGSPEPPLPPTAPFAYLRLRRQDYDDAALERWLDRVRGGTWERAYVYFKHEDEATGPRLAARFLELAGTKWGQSPFL